MITVALSFAESPIESIAGIEEIVLLRGRTLLVPDAERHWKYVADGLISNRPRHRLESLSFVEKDPVWAEGLAGVEGFVLAPDDVQPQANAPGDYDPTLPLPCIGFLPDAMPLRVAERPRGHLAAVGEELVVSGKLRRYLSDLGHVRFGPVVYRGRELSDWSRLLVECTVSMLAPESRRPSQSCALCGSPLTPAIGIYMASEGTVLPSYPCLDDLGFGHLQRNHPIIVQRDIAMEIRQLFGSGIAIQPVYSSDARQSRFVRIVVEGLSELWRARVQRGS